MGTQAPRKPRVVQVTTWLLGLLALSSWVACRNLSEQAPVLAIAEVMRAIVTNVAFVAAISGTRFGRKVVISFLALLASIACFGIYVGVQIFPKSPWQALVIWLLGAALIAWFYVYTFGKSARGYFASLGVAEPLVEGSQAGRA